MIREKHAINITSIDVKCTNKNQDDYFVIHHNEPGFKPIKKAIIKTAKEYELKLNSTDDKPIELYFLDEQR